MPDEDYPTAEKFDPKEAERVAKEDPWKHRSQKMSCETCMWFVEKTATVPLPPRVFGRCRKHAPTMSGYPAVYGTDWCGDHKVDENRA